MYTVSVSVSRVLTIAQNMITVFVFFLVINQGISGLKTLSFENLKYVDKDTNYYFEGNFSAKVKLGKIVLI